MSPHCLPITHLLSPSSLPNPSLYTGGPTPQNQLGVSQRSLAAKRIS